MKISITHYKIRDVMCIPEASATIVFTMAESDRPNMFSKTGSFQALQLSEDDEVLSEASLMLNTE